MSVIESSEIDWIDKLYKGIYFTAARMRSFQRAIEPWNGISPQNISDTCSTVFTLELHPSLNAAMLSNKMQMELC